MRWSTSSEFFGRSARRKPHCCTGFGIFGVKHLLSQVYLNRSPAVREAPRRSYCGVRVQQPGPVRLPIFLVGAIGVVPILLSLLDIELEGLLFLTFGGAHCENIADHLRKSHRHREAVVEVA